jgi:hypothetical protein
MSNKTERLVVFVDVDDTLVRSSGNNRIPMVSVIDHIRSLAGSGATLYCWSSGGPDYAKESAEELGISECFLGYLPKPNVFLDDQSPETWTRTIHVHPLSVGGKTPEDYLNAIESE